MTIPTNLVEIPNNAMIAHNNTWALYEKNAKGQFVVVAPTKFVPIDTPLFAVAGWDAPRPVPTPTPPPVAGTLTSKQLGNNEAQVIWTGFSPIKLGRNGVDTNGTGAWDTGALTGEPTTGSFAFNSLVPGDTYIFTATEAGGKTLTTTLKISVSVTPPPPAQYTVTFNSEGGSSWPSETGNAGTTVMLNLLPVLAGQTFTGWFTAPSGGTQVLSPHVLTANITVYAQWTPNAVTPPPVTPPSGTITPALPAAELALLNLTNPIVNDDFTKLTTLPAHYANSWYGGGVKNGVATIPANVSLAADGLHLKLTAAGGSLISSNPGTAPDGKGWVFGPGGCLEFVATVFNSDWAAGWTVGNGVTWPSGDEFDIEEVLNGGGAISVLNFHSSSFNLNGPEISNLVGAKHKFTFFWDGNNARVYVDGILDDNLTNAAVATTSPQYGIWNHGQGSGIGSDYVVESVRVWALA